VLSLAYYAVQYLAFHAVLNLLYLVVSLLAYYVERYSAYSGLQLSTFPLFLSKKPSPPTYPQSRHFYSFNTPR